MDFEALGTAWHIQSTHSLDIVQIKILAELERIDQTWSRFRPDSMVTSMANSAGTYPLTPTDHDLINFYAQLYQATNGLISPLIGQTLADAGYDANYSLAAKPIISPTPPWEKILHLNPTSLTLTQPQLLDVGAAGKGWAIDQIATILKNHGHTNFIIDAGGDMTSFGSSHTIGLENPLDLTQVIGTVKLTNSSVCGSASNRRKWDNWHHIINPQTSQPVTNIMATWVIAETALKADGLATALFLVEPDHLAMFQPFTYVVLDATGAAYYSPSPQLTLFT